MTNYRISRNGETLAIVQDLDVDRALWSYLATSGETTTDGLIVARA